MLPKLGSKWEPKPRSSQVAWRGESIPNEAAANAEDFVLNLVGPARHGTLVGRTMEGQTGMLEWNVNLQGDDETEFIDINL